MLTTADSDAAGQRKIKASSFKLNWNDVVSIRHKWIQFGNIFRLCLREKCFGRQCSRDTNIEWHAHQAPHTAKHEGGWRNSSNSYCLLFIVTFFIPTKRERFRKWLVENDIDGTRRRRRLSIYGFSIRSIYIYLCRIVCGRLENRFIVLSHTHKVAYRIDYGGAWSMLHDHKNNNNTSQVARVLRFISQPIGEINALYCYWIEEQKKENDVEAVCVSRWLVHVK